MQEITSRKSWVDSWTFCKRLIEDVYTLIELAEESQDESFQKEIDSELEKITNAFADLEFRNMLSGVDDKRTAILTRSRKFAATSTFRTTWTRW